MADETRPSSPRLAALHREVAQTGGGAIEAFWQEVGWQGAPLIEPLAGDDKNSLVTFVWRGAEEAQGVAVVSNLSGRMGASEAMSRLPGTDLWYRTYTLPNDTRESYQFAVAGDNLIDPFNARRHVFPSDAEIGLTGWASSLLELPDAPLQRWFTPRAGVARGQVTLHRMPSDALDHEYRVWVYTPPNYAPENGPYGWLLLFDGWFYLELIPTPTILDNLLAERLLPPLVAILVGHPFDKHRRRDLACYAPFEDFVMRDIVPWARLTYHLTGDPARTVVGGASLGGLMAAYMGLQQAGTFGNVLAQSAFWGWKATEDDEDEWIVRQYAASPKLPIRFSIDAGRFETDQPTPLHGSKNLLLSAQRTRDVLQGHGYAVHYSEFSGGHTPLCWRGTLPDDLLALLGAGA